MLIIQLLMINCFLKIMMMLVLPWGIVDNHQNRPSYSFPDQKPHIVFLISEDPDNYEAHLTIPAFAGWLEKEDKYRTTVIQGFGERHAFEFPGLEILSEADLVVVFCRRIALSNKQMKTFKAYLKKGKPLIGLRTANHAFAVREEEKIPQGFEDWWGFVPEILGCENKGYGPVEPGTEVVIVPGSEDHPIVHGLPSSPWHSEGNLYLVSPLLDTKAEVVLTGSVGEKTEPIAWTRMANGSRVFYTSLGFPKDFESPQFRKLLVNGIDWALEK